MQKNVTGLPAEIAETLNLGVVLGQNHAFGLVAGRCSAAQAASLKRLREEKLYKCCTPHWRNFCATHLKIDGGQADKIIRLWDEFGEPYFEISQLTRISPETYRAIAPSIRDGALHFNGESIELNADNARRVATAVAGLRRSHPRRFAAPPEMHERIAELDRRAAAILDELREISRKERCGENWLQFTAVLTRLLTGLQQIERENGL